MLLEGIRVNLTLNHFTSALGRDSSHSKLATPVSGTPRSRGTLTIVTGGSEEAGHRTGRLGRTKACTWGLQGRVAVAGAFQHGVRGALRMGKDSSVVVQLPLDPGPG